MIFKKDRQRYRQLLLLGIFLMGSFMFTLNNANGLVETKELFFLDSQKSIVVRVSWEKEEPEILFIAPDNTVYSPLKEEEVKTENHSGRVSSSDSVSNTQSDNHKDSVENRQQGSTGIVRTDNAFFYLIQNAMPGTWMITYDKKSNDSIQVSVDDYDAGLWITDFNIKKLDQNNIQTDFNTSYPEAIPYHYTLSAIINDHGSEKVLYEGIAETNQPITQNVYLGSLSSWDNYKLKLYVYFTKGQIDIFDTEYSESFPYENPSAKVPQGDLYISIHPDINNLYINWANLLNGTGDKCIVNLYEDEQSEPTYSSEFARDETATNLLYDASRKLRIELRVFINNVYSGPIIKEVDLENSKGMTVTFDEAEITNRDQLLVYYQRADNSMVTISNNSKSGQYQLDGDGSLKIQLEDDWNQINVTYQDPAQVNWIYEKKIYVDRIPPYIRFPEKMDGIHTSDDQFVIVGIAGDPCQLVINGSNVLMEDDLSFIYPLALSMGKNDVKITAVDMAGNQSVYQCVINRTRGALGGKWRELLIAYLPLLITLAVGAIVSIWAFIYWRKKPRDNN